MSTPAHDSTGLPPGWNLERYRLLVENVPVGILEMTGDGTVVFCNPHLRQLLGWSLAGPSAGLPRLLGERDHRKFWNQLESDGELRDFEASYTAGDGRGINLVINARLCRGAAGRPTTAECAVRDLTACRAAEEALRVAQVNLRHATQIKNEFLANVSHELLTPMNGVQGMLDLLADTRLDVEQQEYLADARDCGDKLLNLIHQILAFNQAEAGTLVLDPVNFSPAALLAEVAALYRARAVAKQLALHTHVTPELPLEVCAPSPVIRRILLALVDNAVRYTPRGAVSLNMHGANGRLYFTVRDTGIGMARDQIDWVLQPFAPVDNNLSRRPSGIGLGLLLAKRLATALGGKFAISSTPGEGTTIAFSTLLPHGAPHWKH
jgi:PAS domain S-box-containing protein